ncbi:MAG: hypothetical protein WC966_10735 [Bradymonadales bacterium]
MKIVFAKHEDPKEYAFEVQPGQQIEKGDLLFLETCQGKTFAFASSGTEEASAGVLERLGAYIPLKKVLGYIPRERFSDAIVQIGKSMARSQELPF